MTENIEAEHDVVESPASPARLSVIGGAVGTVVGLRRSKTAAVAGGVLGGSIGYLAGMASGARTGGGSVDGADEPVVVTVDGTEPSEDVEASEAASEEHDSDAGESADED